MECQEPERGMETEIEGPQKQQTTDDQEEEPSQREPYGTSRRSHSEKEDLLKE